MSEMITVVQAARELALDPSYLRLRISEGKLAADKFGGRDWWIRRGDLRAFDEKRRAVGRPIERRPRETEEQRRLREYNRLQKQKSRDRRKNTN